MDKIFNKESLDLLSGDKEGTLKALTERESAEAIRLRKMEQNDIAFALDKLKEQINQEDTMGTQKAQKISTSSDTQNSVNLRIQNYVDQLRLRHFQDMETVDSLIRSSATNIEMTKSEYLLSLRHMYHNNLLQL